MRLHFDFDKIVTRASNLKKDEEVEIKFYDNKKNARII
jgi:hypothetical protein